MKVTVRTLDSKNHVFELDNDEMTVKEFKELIFPTVNVPVSTQRIIFCGRVLENGKKLKDYGVDNCVVHLVERAPPQPESNQGTGPPRTPIASASSINSNIEDLGGVAQHIVESLQSQFGASNVSANQSGNNLNVNINVSQPTTGAPEILQRLSTAHRFLDHAGHLLQHIQNPSSTGAASGNDESTDVEMTEIADSTSNTETTTKETETANESSTSCEPSVDASNSEASGDASSGERSSHPCECNHNEEESPSSTVEQIENNPATLASIYDQFIKHVQELMPSLQRYRDMLNSPSSVERAEGDDLLSPRIAEVFHDFAHALHAMSDLTCNVDNNSNNSDAGSNDSTNPRTLMCYPQLSPLVMMQPPTNGSRIAHGPNTSTASSIASQVQVTRPIAVAATMVHIPNGQQFSMIQTTRQSRTTTSSTTPLTSSAPSSASTTAPISSSARTTVTNPETLHAQMLQSILGGGNFGQIQNNSGGGMSIPNSHMFLGIPPQQQSQTGGRPPTGTVLINTPQGRAFQRHQGNANANQMGGLQDILQGIVHNVVGSSNVAGVHSTVGGPQVTNPSSTAGTPPVTSETSASIAGENVTPATSTQPNENSTSQPNVSSQRPRYTPHAHHHHHNRDGSVIHPDTMLQCQSFHFGPTFHESGGGSGERRIHVGTIEINQIEVEDVDSTETNSTTTSSSRHSTSTPGSGSSVDPIENAIMENLMTHLSAVAGGNNRAQQAGTTENVSVTIERDGNVEMNGDTPLSAAGLDMAQIFRMFGAGQPNPNMQTTGSGQVGQTLGDFITSHFGESVQRTNDDFFSELMESVANELTVTDLFTIILGTSREPLDRFRPVMRRLIEKHYNDEREITSADINAVSERMTKGFAEVTSGVSANLTVRNDINLERSASLLVYHQFKSLLQLLIGDPALFSPELVTWYEKFLSWEIALMDYAVVGGAEEYTNALFRTESFQNVVGQLPESYRMGLPMLIGRMRSVAGMHPVSREQLDEILVKASRVDAEREKPSSSDSGERASKRVRKNEEEQGGENGAVNVEELWEEKHGGNDASEDSDAEPAPSPEDWHSRIPNDWLVVINRDIDRQRRMVPQRPYSDAYLSGLPKKKRKLLTQQTGDEDRVDVGSTLKNVIKKTNKEVKEKELQEDVENTDLQAMFEATFRHDIRQRLQGDVDYHPKQHPNSEKYFMKGQDKKEES